MSSIAPYINVIRIRKMLLYMYCVKLDHALYSINYDNTHRNFKPYPAIGNEGIPVCTTSEIN